MMLGQVGHVKHEWVTERVGGGGVGIVHSCWGMSRVLGQSDSVLSGWVEWVGGGLDMHRFWGQGIWWSVGWVISVWISVSVNVWYMYICLCVYVCILERERAYLKTVNLMLTYFWAVFLFLSHWFIQTICQLKNLNCFSRQHCDTCVGMHLISCKDLGGGGGGMPS